MTLLNSGAGLAIIGAMIFYLGILEHRDVGDIEPLWVGGAAAVLGLLVLYAKIQ